MRKLIFIVAILLSLFIVVSCKGYSGRYSDGEEYFDYESECDRLEQELAAAHSQIEELETEKEELESKIEELTSQLQTIESYASDGESEASSYQGSSYYEMDDALSTCESYFSDILSLISY